MLRNGDTAATSLRKRPFSVDDVPVGAPINLSAIQQCSTGPHYRGESGPVRRIRAKRGDSR